MFDNFVNHLTTDLLNAFPGATVTPKDMVKLNDQILHSLIVQQSGSDIAPTIYTDPLYDALSNGEPYEEILNYVLKQAAYVPTNNGQPLDVDKLVNWEDAKSHLTYRLVSRKLNTRYLADKPFIPVYDDLAIIFAYYLDIIDTLGGGAFVITNEHLAKFGVDVSELQAVATENTPRILPLRQMPMVDMLKTMMPYEQWLEIREKMKDDPEVVITNQASVFGASTLLYPDVLKNFADEVDSDVIILPSSIHELILIPVNKLQDKTSNEDLNSMVTSVNQTRVPEGEILSDHAYRYLRAQDAIVSILS